MATLQTLASQLEETMTGIEERLVKVRRYSRKINRIFPRRERDGLLVSQVVQIINAIEVGAVGPKARSARQMLVELGG